MYTTFKSSSHRGIHHRFIISILISIESTASLIDNYKLFYEEVKSIIEGWPASILYIYIYIICAEGWNLFLFIYRAMVKKSIKIMYRCWFYWLVSVIMLMVVKVRQSNCQIVKRTTLMCSYLYWRLSLKNAIYNTTI